MGSTINVMGVYEVNAPNRLSIRNTVAAVGGMTRHYGLADFDASEFRLFDWHFYAHTVLLANVDIYNDPIYWNSLAFDRITGRSAANLLSNLANVVANQDDDDIEGFIDGLWLLLEDEEDEGEGFLEAFGEPEPIGIPVAERSLTLGW